MHIPDGFLSTPVAAAGCVVAAGCVACAVKATHKKMGEKQVPLMGVSAAFIFAAQMLNFPVAGGTSGHLIGAALAAILLGPWAGVLIMTCVLVVQCLVFQDGGLFALGANIFNMGIIGSFVGYYVYRGGAWLFGGQKRGKLIGGGLAAWFSVVVASVACAFELGVSGTVPLGVAVPTMGSVHAIIGIGEGLITAAVLGLVLATRADLLELQINGILRGDNTVKVLGLPVEEKNLRQIRQKVGLVFQEPEDQLFSATVFDDVAFGPINLGYPEAEVKRRVAQALDWVGMTGYEQRSSHRLSVGEKKRIAIATVLSMDPELLVIDEPSSNLDPRSKWSLVELLRRLPMTKVIATHDLELVKALCQRTIIIDEGMVTADGSTESILGDIPLLRAHGLAPSRY